ncbi:MAG: STAS domain-containing protein [Bdellovibrionales bacterium]|nr:STAS domain-containing protein [Bdellovibrionales bacterium]
MKAKLEQKDDVVVISLSGRIEMDYSEPFHHACLKDIANRSENLIFNLNELSFVGSNGIMPFVKTLHELAAMKKNKIRFCEVSSEFKRIFAASSLAAVEIFETELKALESFKSEINLEIIEKEAASS